MFGTSGWLSFRSSALFIMDIRTFLKKLRFVTDFTYRCPWKKTRTKREPSVNNYFTSECYNYREPGKIIICLQGLSYTVLIDPRGLTYESTYDSLRTILSWHPQVLKHYSTQTHMYPQALSYEVPRSPKRLSYRSAQKTSRTIIWG